MIMIDLTEKQFFALLSSALWNKKCPLELFVAGGDWHTIIRMAGAQTLTAVLFDGYNRLMKDYKKELTPIPLEQMLEWYAMVATVEAQNELLNENLLRLETFCHEAGIKTLLLKGQGCAALYPHPNHRHCGDIDLFVGREQYYAMKKLLLTKEFEIEKETRKDLHFTWHQTSVECHKMALHYYNPFINKRLQRINRTEEWHNTCSFVVNGVKVGLFNPTYNAFFIFMHIHHHFVQTGVGLRQVCDWVLHMKANEDLIDWNRLYKYVQEVRVLKAWNAFNGFAKAYLGLQLRNEPIWMKKYSLFDVEFLKRDIMQVGNFGIISESMLHRSVSNGFCGNFYSYFLIFKRLCRIYKYGPEEILAYPVWKMLAKIRVVKY